MNRRGFLAGLLTAVAAVAIEVKLASPKPLAPDSHLRWDEANSRYDYGIDPNDPLDVVIYDNVDQRFVEPKELMHTWMHVDQNVNTYGDKFDLAYEATALIAMSQGFLLWKRGEKRLVTIDDQVLSAEVNWPLLDELATKPHGCLCNGDRKRINPACPAHGDDAMSFPYILTGAIAT